MATTQGAPGSAFDVVWAHDLAARGVAGLSLRMVGPPGQTPIRVYQAQDGLIAGNPSLLGLRRDPPLILAESSPYPDRVPMLAQEIVSATGLVPDSTESLSSVCALDRLWAANNWHWFMESVPVVAALEEAGFDGCYIVPAESAACAESLALLGIAPNRIMPGRAGCRGAKSIFFTEPFGGHQLARWPWLIQWVRARARRNFPPAAGAKRVYVARRGNSRRVLNEQELVEKLSSHGFVTAYMEDLSLRDQLCLLRDAEIVAGPHGAGLVYTMFMPEHGSFIECFHARYINPCMTSVCGILDIDYRMVVSDVNPMDNVRKDDLIFVPMEVFSLALKAALRRTERRAGGEAAGGTVAYGETGGS